MHAMLTFTFWSYPDMYFFCGGFDVLLKLAFFPPPLPTLQLHSCLLLLRKISEILFEDCYSTFLASNFRLLQSLVILLIEYCSLLAELMCSCPTVSKRGPPIAMNLAVVACFSCKAPLFPGHVTWGKAVIFPGTETWLFLYCNICHCVRLFLHIFYSCWQRVPRQIFFTSSYMYPWIFRTFCHTVIFVVNCFMLIHLVLIAQQFPCLHWTFYQLVCKFSHLCYVNLWWFCDEVPAFNVQI